MVVDKLEVVGRTSTGHYEDIHVGGPGPIIPKLLHTFCYLLINMSVPHYPIKLVLDICISPHSQQYSRLLGCPFRSHCHERRTRALPELRALLRAVYAARGEPHARECHVLP